MADAQKISALVDDLSPEQMEKMHLLMKSAMPIMRIIAKAAMGILTEEQRQRLLEASRG